MACRYSVSVYSQDLTGLTAGGRWMKQTLQAKSGSEEKDNKGLPWRTLCCAAAGGVSVSIQGSGDKTMLQKELCYFFSVKCLLRHNSPRKKPTKKRLLERPVPQLTGIILVAFKALIRTGLWHEKVPHPHIIYVCIIGLGQFLCYYSALLKKNIQRTIHLLRKGVLFPVQWPITHHPNL